ncbi:MAG: hypothetical protein K0R54_807 [Clostridiaceae bacterium]|nr:hypothetical protein [Clostridiaceae bacterium]
MRREVRYREKGIINEILVFLALGIYIFSFLYALVGSVLL